MTLNYKTPSFTNQVVGNGFISHTNLTRPKKKNSAQTISLKKQSGDRLKELITWYIQ